MATARPTATRRPGASARAAAGNYLSLTASFSANARDWSAYRYDRTHFAAFSFAPTGCDGNAGSCYAAAPYAGVSVSHGAVGNPNTYAETLVPLDLTQTHTFEWLLKNGQVDYRIDGNVVTAAPPMPSCLAVGWPAPACSSLAMAAPPLTGTGSMTILANAVDTAPIADHLAPVPEPTTAALLLAGLGWLGGANGVEASAACAFSEFSEFSEFSAAWLWPGSPPAAHAPRRQSAPAAAARRSGTANSPLSHMGHALAQRGLIHHRRVEPQVRLKAL